MKFSTEETLHGINKAAALIHFEPDGTIVDANVNFLSTLGYELKEVVGKHHKIFVPENIVNSPEYKKFWLDLAKGVSQVGDFSRVNKAGKFIHIYASYSPITDAKGKVIGVVKVAMDKTDQKNREIDYKGQIEAIKKSQAVIEFNMDGTIITANDNFTEALGYELEEIQGSHHRIFCESDYASSKEYRKFWQDLNKGEYASGTYKRIRKDGSEIWIQATYNPILGFDGKPFKVVKYASDVSAQKLKELEAMEVSKTQGIIELTADGHVITASQKFLSYFGYTMDEIKGQHHSALCTKELSTSPEYENFWRDLRTGRVFQGRFPRVGKNNQTVWLDAVYTPIRDFSGKVFKIVKYASDITQQVEAEEREKEVFKGIEKNSVQVASSATELTVQANQMGASAKEILGEIDLTNDMTMDLRQQMDSILSSTEEMTVAVKEISNGAQEAAKISNDAVENSNNTNAIMSELSNSSAEISTVVKAIHAIAQQTNLLALNATIEAARAGEAGKGFAVVASEVKELAKETRNATEDITKRIEKIQGDTANALDSNAKITDIISRLSEIANTTASSVEEQSVTTSEMSKSVSHSNDGLSKISHSMNKIHDQMNEMSTGVNENTTAASNLSELSEKLAALLKQA